MKFTQLNDLELSGKRVFIRLDLNVPLTEDGGRFSVADSTRLEAALPTIKYVMDRGGKCLLASHLGRPKGEANAKYSLEPVGRWLSGELKREVILTDACVGDGARALSQQMKEGDLLLLENLRFFHGEEENSADFTNRLAELCEVYVNDAFGTLHRAHASTFGLPSLMSAAQKAPGLLVQQELDNLLPLRDAPKRPFVLIMGGSKVSDKIGVIEHLFSKVDTILVGGAMAYAFLRAAGKTVGKSLCKDDQVKLAERLIKGASARGVQLKLPLDHAIVRQLEENSCSYTEGPDIPDEYMGVDIGPKTLAVYEEALSTAETVFWNGPMGIFERPEFAKGTFQLAKVVAQSKARKMSGGGDVVAAISMAGCKQDFDFISTGGGATLNFLEGRELPGLAALAHGRNRS